MQVFRAVVRGLAVADLSGRVVLAEQPAQHVDFVNHGILDRHGVVPVVRNGRVAVCAVQQQRFTVLAAVNRRLELLVSLVVAAHEADLNQFLASLHLSLNNVLAGICLRSQRLLAEYILAGCDRSQNVLLVIRVGRGAHNGVDFRGVYHVDGVFEALDAVLLGNRKTEGSCRVSTSNNLAALQRVVDAFDVGAADSAGAYKTNS